MLDMDEMRMNEMILQTFEEMEQTFSFPLTTQREARAFTKVLRTKGLTSKLIGSCIGESEQALTAWQGGQSNQQIGRMMIARINLPLVELLSTDDEDDESDAQKELAKKNTEKHTTAKREKDPVHLLSSEKKQQKATDLTSSWIKQIETKMAAVEVEPNGGVEWGDNDGGDQADPVGERNRLNHKKETSTKDSSSHQEPAAPLHRKSVAYEVAQNIRRSSIGSEMRPLKDKEPEKTPQVNHHNRHDPPRKQPESHRDATDGSARKNRDMLVAPSETSTEATSELVEVVEQPINKEIALENFATILNKNWTPPDASTATDTSAASIVTETIVPQTAGLTAAHQHHALPQTSEPSVRSASSFSQPPAEESPNDHYEQEVNENYDSDLDTNNGDVSTQAVLIRKNIRTLKGRMDDGSGYLYIFCDNAGKASNHRIKIGASRFPAKRLEQACTFNLDIEMVSAVSVGSRKSALQDTIKALQQYQLPNSTSWFEGPLPKILDIVARVANKFPLQTATFA